MRRITRTALFTLSLALSLAERASAHRLDECLQATLIGVTRDGIDVEIRLTPGVAMLPLWMAVVDRDRNGQISPEEERVYVGQVMRDVELRVDGRPAPLSLIESSFPTLQSMQEGLGSIVIKLRAARGGHQVRFENRHLPQVSAYLVNCLAGPEVGRQQRDEAQRSIEFEYSFGTDRGRYWLAAIGLLLVFRMWGRHSWRRVGFSRLVWGRFPMRRVP
jgi:hypothetical protein